MQAERSGSEEEIIQAELQEREKANAISEQYDNLKIMGDIHIRLINLQVLDGREKVVELEAALSCYISAVPLAYWNDKSFEYYSELWNAIAYVFAELEKCNMCLDEAHIERAGMLAEITASFGNNPPML